MSIQFRNGMTANDINNELLKIMNKDKQNEIKKMSYKNNVFSNKNNIFEVDDNAFITLNLFNEIKRNRYIFNNITNLTSLEKNKSYNLKDYVKDKVSDNFFLKSFIVTITTLNNEFEYEFNYWMFEKKIHFNNIQFFINENDYFCLQLWDNEEDKILIFNDNVVDKISFINILCK